ncbi:hypothetical protein [Microbulbifer sp. JMSA008]|uniref:hypothetical protein n=1 Tax=Microbulbifer sp. JMSA008 TaxID=3243373 RepID=UPI004039A659
MKYVKEYWDESRGDDFDHWGETWYYFEINESDNYANRQICVYTIGNSLKYDRGDCIDDEYGFLCDQPIELNESTIEISQKEFEEVWQKNQAKSMELVSGKA